ncbi:liver carboxylesterase 1 [Toxorhynchites rutilus septentrionalis]|uniref:liver carboxylesterase 1 n=1 Tax=Toxorhynchites rutilus septentrionalis TaxID=329112 RepID=UPI002478A9DE|nr:liver carboxylesterase 1 [Toxorhynchites rutilus septentrionalis]
MANNRLVLVLLAASFVQQCVSRDPPAVEIPDQGSVIGTYIKMFRTQRVIAYLGIPYAQAPVKEKRFTPPVVDNLPSWDDVKNASTLAAQCWPSPRGTQGKHNQLFMDLIKSAEMDEPQYDEDCLFLNIYIPDATIPTEGFSVLVWFPASEFDGDTPFILNPFQMVFKQKLIVVTVQYRLGIFGFFTTMDGEAPGNFGLMDQSAALLWINKNIKLFNGNEASVTIIGHGTGGVCVGLHLTSGEWTEQMFHKAIIMSGSVLLDSVVRTPKHYSPILDELATTYGCYRRPTSSLVECLRRVEDHLLVENSHSEQWGPVIDKGLSNITTPFISDPPMMMIHEGKLRKVPLLIGHTDMEEALELTIGDMVEHGIGAEMYESLLEDAVTMDLFQMKFNDSQCGGNMETIMDAVQFQYKPYPPTTDPMMLRTRYIEFATDRKYVAPTIELAMHMSHQAETYVYRFDIKPRTKAVLNDIPEWMGVPHNFELIFLWGLPYWLMLADQMQWDSADKRVSDIVMTLWANFAKFTNPTQVGVYIKWDTFTNDEPGVLIIDRSFNMSDHTTMNFNAVKFWNHYYPNVISFAAQCCNDTYNSGTSYQNMLSSSVVYSILVANFILLQSFIYMQIQFFFQT